MWHAAHSAPLDPASWWWCWGMSYFDGAWHWAHTALPGALSCWVWGSWQSLQVTPWANILLCRNEP